MNPTMLLSHIQKQYPSVEIMHGNKVIVGRAMTELGFEYSDRSNVFYYKVVPLKVA